MLLSFYKHTNITRSPQSQYMLMSMRSITLTWRRRRSNTLTVTGYGCCAVSYILSFLFSSDEIGELCPNTQRFIEETIETKHSSIALRTISTDQLKTLTFGRRSDRKGGNENQATNGGVATTERSASERSFVVCGAAKRQNNTTPSTK